MTAPQYETYDDADRLRKLYWDAGLSQRQIGDLYGVSSVTIGRAMRRNGVPSRQHAAFCNFMTGKQGYERWDSDGETLYVHQMSAIAGGADPFKVFSDDYVVHHENKIPWDNRPGNLAVLSHQEHAQVHSQDGGREKYTDDELLEWIGSFVDVTGVVPRRDEMSDAPGPCAQTYVSRFGSWRNAVRKAGYTPRGVQE